MIDKTQLKQLREQYEKALANTTPDQDLFGPLATDQRDVDIDPDSLIDEPRTAGLTQPESQVLQDERAAALREALDELARTNKPRNGVAIFRKLHGLDDHMPLGVSEVAREFQISTERVKIITRIVTASLIKELTSKYAYLDLDSRTPAVRWKL